MDEAKTATLLIIAPEEARRASTTFAIDTKHPSPPGLETDINGEVSLAPGQVGFFRPYPALMIIVLIVQGERERERGGGRGKAQVKSHKRIYCLENDV